MSERLNYSGLVVAALGFFLTRFTVTLALYENPVQFYLAGVAPLALGLGLAAFGVALTVADIDGSMVRTTAIWCVIGFVTMLTLVVLTLLGSSTDGAVSLSTVRSQAYLSNFLIGGSIGGTLTGLYASRNRQHRGDLEEQANRLVTLNRMLRHEVLNAVTAIRGYANVDPQENPEGMRVIDDRATDIQQTIEEVKYLTEQAGTETTSRLQVDIGESLQESIETITDRHPNASVSVGSVPDNLSVYANPRLPLVFTHLLENAIVHGDDDAPVVDVAISTTTVTVSITDEGPGLPEPQQSLLETGEIAEFDDPRVGFGLNIVRLLVSGSGGRIDTDVDKDGTTVTVDLPRVRSDGTPRLPSRAELTDVRPAVPHLVVTAIAAVIAGIPYGIASELLGGSVAGIGVFYGTVDPLIGWLTHEFHSVVFGFMYIGVLSLALERYRDTTGIYEAVGVVWSIVVWIVAASFVAPIWLRLLGIGATIPNFSTRLLVSHLAWGLTLGGLTNLGYRYVMPWLVEHGRRLWPP